jgi:hypothetical protein
LSGAAHDDAGARGQDAAAHHHAHVHHNEHDLRYLAGGAQPEVLAGTAGLTFDPPVAQAGVEAAVREFLRRLSPALAAAGCVLVGHIKGVVVADGDELEFSLTRLDGIPRFSGTLDGAVPHAALTLNVIVFGVDAEVLADVVTRSWPDDVAPAAWHLREP